MGDPDSIHLITRSILESYLIFHHLFIFPSTAAEREFWWFTWVLKSLLSRTEKMNEISENMPTKQFNEQSGVDEIKLGKDVKANMLKNAAQIQEKLRENEFYKSKILMTEKSVQKMYKRLVDEGWKSSPTQSLRDANMKHFISWDIYGFYSDAAHGDHISIRQLLLTKSHEEQISFAEASFNIVLMIMARLCVELPIVFQQIAPILEKNRKATSYAVFYKLMSETEGKLADAID